MDKSSNSIYKLSNSNAQLSHPMEQSLCRTKPCKHYATIPDRVSSFVVRTLALARGLASGWVSARNPTPTRVSRSTGVVKSSEALPPVGFPHETQRPLEFRAQLTGESQRFFIVGNCPDLILAIVPSEVSTLVLATNPQPSFVVRTKVLGRGKH